MEEYYRKKNFNDDKIKEMILHLKEANEKISHTDITMIEIHKFDDKLINKIIKQKSADVVFVDHIQSFSISDKIDNRAAAFSNIANNLKSMALTNDILIVVGSQQNRMGGAGSLDSLKESGGIAEACDVALLLERLEDTLDMAENKIGYNIHISKNRDGMTGKPKLYFSYKYGKFIQ
jgi:replicative DNA helicase